MKKVLNLWLAAYAFCWCLVHGFRWLQAPLPFFNSYLTDFLFIPAVSHLALHFFRAFVTGSNTYRFPLSYLLFFALYATLVFEWAAPLWSGRYTADSGDAIAYFLGSIFYYYVHQGRRQAGAAHKKRDAGRASLLSEIS